jgi:adenylate cyclase, class 2
MPEPARAGTLLLLPNEGAGNSFWGGGTSVAIETEIKLKIRDPEEFRRSLRSLQPVLLAARHLEDNHLLDHPDGRIRAQYCMLRVRAAGANSSLTFKGPARPTGVFKVREEIETPIGDPAVVLAVFEKLGMQVWFRYQKYREEYEVRTAAIDAPVRLAIDETPVGDYIEIEGPEDSIRAVAAEVGFDESEFLRDSYYALYLKFCRNLDIQPGHMIFSARQKDQGQASER